MADIFFLEFDKTENHLVSTFSTVLVVKTFTELMAHVMSFHAFFLSWFVRVGLKRPLIINFFFQKLGSPSAELPLDSS